jgi:hypothetical protein
MENDEEKLENRIYKIRNFIIAIIIIFVIIPFLSKLFENNESKKINKEISNNLTVFQKSFDFTREGRRDLILSTSKEQLNDDLKKSKIYSVVFDYMENDTVINTLGLNVNGVFGCFSKYENLNFGFNADSIQEIELIKKTFKSLEKKLELFKDTSYVKLDKSVIVVCINNNNNKRLAYKITSRDLKNWSEVLSNFINLNELCHKKQIVEMNKIFKK